MATTPQGSCGTLLLRTTTLAVLEVTDTLRLLSEIPQWAWKNGPQRGWGSLLHVVHPPVRRDQNNVVLTEVTTSLIWQAGVQGKGLWSKPRWEWARLQVEEKEAVKQQLQRINQKDQRVASKGRGKPQGLQTRGTGDKTEKTKVGSHYTQDGPDSLPLIQMEDIHEGARGGLVTIHFQFSPHLPSMTKNVTNFWWVEA